MVSKAKSHDTERVEHIHDADNEIGQLANQQEHELSPLQAILKRPKSFAWGLFAISTCLLVSFENQAAGMVLSVPEFRKDFGHEFAGGYVLDADWQSAFYGGPVASSVIGTFCAGYLADRFGRKPLLITALLVSFAAITLEFLATYSAMFFGGKFLNGFAIGTILSVSVTYIGEVG